MNPAYRLTAEADDDLVKTWLHTLENWGRNQANTYLEQLEARFISLAKKPDSGKSRDYIRPGYLSYHETRHVIFYRVIKDKIEIARILHDRMDYGRHL